jgi:hypothetical protein
MTSLPNIDALSTAELRAVVADLLEQISGLRRVVAEQRDEIARLKGLNGRPDVKPNVPPSGMEKANRAIPNATGPDRRGGGPKTRRRVIHEDCIVKVAAPAGSRFKGIKGCNGDRSHDAIGQKCPVSLHKLGGVSNPPPQ